LFVSACQNDAGQVLNTFLAGVRGFRGGHSKRNMALKLETLLPRFVSDPEISFARQQRIDLHEVCAPLLYSRYRLTPLILVAHGDRVGQDRLWAIDDGAGYNHSRSLQ